MHTDPYADTPAQAALTWLAAQGPDVIPIPGTRRRSRLEENVAALDLTLTTEEGQQLDQLRPRGQRYPDMTWVQRDTPSPA